MAPLIVPATKNYGTMMETPIWSCHAKLFPPLNPLFHPACAKVRTGRRIEILDFYLMTRDQFHAITEQKGWGPYAASFLTGQRLTPEAADKFGTYWIEAGHHIREQIADDRVLVQLLRHILPLYEGEAIELFRGENRNRWEKHAIGLAWTSNLEIAKMFGSGLNAVHSGGVLLKARFEPQAIISGPNSHSRYLDEDQFTIDPFSSSTFSAIEFFPRVA